MTAATAKYAAISPAFQILPLAYRSQKRTKSGIVHISLKHSMAYARGYPLANAWHTARITNAKENAFTPARIGRNQYRDKKTAVAEISKGRNITPSKPTVDTGCKKAMRTKEETEPSEQYDKHSPQKSPMNQPHARETLPSLRIRAEKT